MPSGIIGRFNQGFFSEFVQYRVYFFAFYPEHTLGVPSKQNARQESAT